MTTKHWLERTIDIRASRETVARFFTEASAFADWWGAGSHIDARPGGTLKICYPNKVEASGEVIAVREQEHIEFTFGYASGEPFAPGTTTVALSLADSADGTRVHLHHQFAAAAHRDAHDMGWRFQLATLANRAADLQHADLAARADEWLAACGEQDAATCSELLEKSVSADVRYHDAFGCVSGREELAAHLAALRMHLGEVVSLRTAAPRHCQGTALLEWTMGDAHASAALTLARDGRIASITRLP